MKSTGIKLNTMEQWRRGCVFFVAYNDSGEFLYRFVGIPEQLQPLALKETAARIPELKGLTPKMMKPRPVRMIPPPPRRLARWERFSPPPPSEMIAAAGARLHIVV